MQYIIDKFFSQSQVKKMLFLDTIYTEKIITIPDMAMIIKQNNKRTYEMANFLTEDIAMFSQKKLFIYKNGVFFINKSISNYEWHTITNNLKRNYVEESISFSVFKNLLSKTVVNIVQMSMELNVSISYLYKILQKIEVILSSTSIESRLEKDKGECKLVGNELHIRYMYYYFQLFLNNIEETVHYDIKIETLRKINSDRISQRKKLPECSREATLIAEIVKSSSKVFFFDTTNFNSESIFFYNLLLYYCPELFEDHIYEKIWRYLQEYGEDNSFIEQTNLLSKSLDKIVSSKKDRILGEVAVKYIVYVELQLLSILSLKGTVEINNPNQKSIASDIDSIFSKNFSSEQYKNTFSFHISETIYLLTIKKRILKVAILLIRRSTNRNLFIKTLLSIFGENNLKIDSDIDEQTDIVITDSYLQGISNQIEYIYLTNINDPKVIKQVADSIQNRILEKYIIAY